MKIPPKVLAFLLFVSALGVIAAAATVPHTFRAGDLISAEKMNANFQAILDGVVHSLNDKTGNVTIEAGANVTVDDSQEGKIVIGATATDGSGTAYSAGAGLVLSGTTFSHGSHGGDASGTTSLVVTGLQGRPVSSTPPYVGDTLVWNGTAWTPTEPAPVGYGFQVQNYSDQSILGDGTKRCAPLLGVMMFDVGNDVVYGDPGHCGSSVYYFVAPESGLYAFDTTLTWYADATVPFGFEVNGRIAHYARPLPPSSKTWYTSSTSTLLKLLPGDTVNVVVAPSGDVSLTPRMGQVSFSGYRVD